MLINRDYIIQRMTQLIDEKQLSNQQARISADKLYKIKQYFPKWIRQIIFHPFNPVYSVYIQYKQNKRKKGKFPLQPLYPFATDFVKYCTENSIGLDTKHYYPQEDESTIVSFIDNRLKSIIPGYEQTVATSEQTEMFKRRNYLYQSSTKIAGGYTLSLDDKNYFLPHNSFEEPVFIHEYGLKYLPESVIRYIAGKDFLDVGAFIGDTALLFAKKYSPKQVYAYEPVKENIELLEKTIAGNKSELIVPIKKGLGDKNSLLEIFVDIDHLSGSSTNQTTINNQRMKQTIEVTTIDSECKSRTVGLIKMDIEGAEYSAITGGLETIKRDKPVLLISMYHTGKDFFEIPPILKEAVPEYLFRFMNIEIVNPFSEKILIAYPDFTDK